MLTDFGSRWDLGNAQFRGTALSSVRVEKGAELIGDEVRVGVQAGDVVSLLILGSFSGQGDASTLEAEFLKLGYGGDYGQLLIQDGAEATISRLLQARLSSADIGITGQGSVLTVGEVFVMGEGNLFDSASNSNNPNAEASVSISQSGRLVTGNDGIDPTQIHKALQRIRDKSSLNFIPWGPASVQVATARTSPFVTSPHKVSGMLLANHTSMAELFDRLLKQYDRIRSRNAFLDNYRREPMFSDSLDELDHARETVQQLVDEYRACERPDYVQFGCNTTARGTAGGSTTAGGASVVTGLTSTGVATTATTSRRK